jgi:hypothetical protein
MTDLLANQRIAGLQKPILIALVAVLLLYGCESNLAWQGTKAYVPPSAEKINVDGFGINDDVDVLPSGALTPPIHFTRTITNTSKTPVSAGYIIRERVVHWIFRAIAGTAGYIEGPASTHLILECQQPGPALAPGASATIDFMFPGPQCRQINPPGATLTALPCGLYQETLTIDTNNNVRETNEGDNESKHFFFVPSNVQKINITVLPDPAIPNANMRIVAGRIIALPNTPPNTPALRFIVAPIPLTAVYSVRGRNIVIGSLAGNRGVHFPALPIVNTTGITGIAYNVTTNPNYVGACTDILNNVYEEKIDSKITAISLDGCVIAQKVGKVSVWHECR